MHPFTPVVGGVQLKFEVRREKTDNASKSATIRVGRSLMQGEALSRNARFAPEMRITPAR
jgi:hypothetical protein